MKHIRTYQIALLCLLALALGSCKKWLNVKPEDKFTEEMIYSNPEGFANAMNGIYMKMAGNDLYGRGLTLTTLDIMAQRYAIGNTTLRTYPVSKLDYTEATFKATLDVTWQRMFLCIAGANELLSNLNKYGNVLTPAQSDLYKGQAYALRAFLHFDVFRLWGPIYTVDSSSLAIPYYRKLSSEVVSFIPARQVLDSVLDDLKMAEQLMAKDPVVAQGSVLNNTNGYRINLIAVKALQARVLLYRNDKPAALAKAKETIALGHPVFPWATYSSVVESVGFQDRIFGSEVLFGVYANSLYQTSTNLFMPNTSPDSILAAGTSSLLETVYEGNQADYRYTQNWLLSSSGVSYRTLAKYYDASRKDRYPFRYMVPLIRLSEMYYIAAECETDKTAALGYLDSVRVNRQRTPVYLPATADLEAELSKEYQKEFYAEGQLWYFFKRKKMTTITSANNNAGIKISLNQYVLPVPESETSVR
ncbi:RagB/SusD family nutrient uptake outer membrane protein [Chitinophaga sp. sic0106]|uniref:RagB/SusD family nutrient uptake outer membrane protein n=1 Tax=Chitinophaga sp. sic0106 TaxID=2854785 RepID=UPI001C4516D5|nr:RagB/SusD family nutrient uptake outer membrane protein [Chitinophaga sp. sic0106]MBV7529849.1 RagB/SusD family nutrient uptake outer membrane protein [Chitinophaga sp. sic0106]